jgi:predicted MFS family arabinose efflux permease
VPLAWALGRLELLHLYGVAFFVGTATVFFGVGSQSMTPDLVGLTDLQEANQSLAVSESIGMAVGPGLGGALVSAFSASLAILVDAVSYLISFFLLLSVHTRPRRMTSVPESTAPLRTQIAEGVAFVRHHRTLRPIVMCATAANFLSHVQQAVFITYMVRSMHYSAAVVGGVFMGGNLGVLLGSGCSNRLSRVLRLGQTLWIMPLVGAAGMLCIPLAPHSFSAPVIALGWFLATASSAVFNIAQLSYRQAVTPDHLRGRMNATVRTFLSGAIPIGFLVGGWLGATAGLRPTLLIAGALNFAPFMLVRFSAAAVLSTHNDVSDVSDDGRRASPK